MHKRSAFIILMICEWAYCVNVVAGTGDGLDGNSPNKVLRMRIRNYAKLFENRSNGWNRMW